MKYSNKRMLTVGSLERSHALGLDECGYIAKMKLADYQNKIRMIAFDRVIVSMLECWYKHLARSTSVHEYSHTELPVCLLTPFSVSPKLLQMQI